MMSPEENAAKEAEDILKKFAPAAKEIISELKADNLDKNLVATEEEIIALEKYVRSKTPPVEITFKELKEHTGVEFSHITNGLLTLITSGKIIGFINDRLTPDPSDDILILRENRIVIEDDEI